ncbi:FecR family protein [Carboxylicivirga sp. N1Y90]|uniref:FecR family protein n=1 Tax=Carboxylicivirga fragile TaxID=3417571 RepID=UPI003D32F935|nr:FecR family protein [Marinilabiliaceae bacterium N1Y90]
MDPKRVIKLILNHLKDALSSSEAIELEEWKSGHEKRSELISDISDEQKLSKELSEFSKVDAEKSWDQLLSRLDVKSHSSSIFMMRFVRVAAIFIMLLSVAGAIYLFIPQNNKVLVSDAISVEPGAYNAVLSIEGEDEILLNDTSTAELKRDNKLLASVKHGKLNYASDGKISSTKMLLIVPEKAEFQLDLSDGTKVWMNAGSMLSFHHPFDANKREVYVEGEVYFEVKPDKTKPFIVDVAGKNAIEVLGTSFNVKAYPEDHVHEAVLVEGSVVWKTAIGRERIMEPQQRLTWNSNTSDVEIENVDSNIYTAWIDGQFVFESTRLEDIMKPVSRWYGVNIEYDAEDIKNMPFSVDVKRYEDLQTILKMLEATQKIKFELKDTELLISRK